MKVSLILPTVTLLLMLLIEEGLGIKCYVCNSYLRGKCDEDVTQHQDQFLQECQANATACRKIKQKVWYDKDYNRRVIRQCAYEADPPMKCIDRTGTYRYEASYCHCLGEGCNNAVTTTVTVTVVSMAIGLAHFLKHL